MQTQRTEINMFIIHNHNQIETTTFVNRQIVALSVYNIQITYMFTNSNTRPKVSCHAERTECLNRKFEKLYEVNLS